MSKTNTELEEFTFTAYGNFELTLDIIAKSEERALELAKAAAADTGPALGGGLVCWGGDYEYSEGERIKIDWMMWETPEVEE